MKHCARVCTDYSFNVENFYDPLLALAVQTIFALNKPCVQQHERLCRLQHYSDRPVCFSVWKHFARLRRSQKLSCLSSAQFVSQLVRFPLLSVLLCFAPTIEVRRGQKGGREHGWRRYCFLLDRRTACGLFVLTTT